MEPAFRLRLFHYWRSSSSWRVRWALQIKKVPCDFVAVNLLSDEPEGQDHLKRNPMGYVPVLEILGSESKFKFLAESVAIVEWVEETYPTPALLPRATLDRARIRQLCQIVNSGIQPLQNLNVTQEVSADPVRQKAWNQLWIRKGFSAYEKLVSESAGNFSFGDSVTLADLFLVPQCYNAGRNEVSLDEFPIIQRIYGNAMKSEPCIASSPDRFK